MSSGQDEVLSLFREDSERSFSGFSAQSSEDEVPESSKRKKKCTKSQAKKTTTKKSKKNSETSSRGQDGVQNRGQKDTGKQCSNPVIDLNKLSPTDIENLRQVLGIQPTYAEESLGPLESLPNIHVEVDRNDISGSEDDHPTVGANFNEGFNKALFGDENNNEDEDSWDLPKLKTPKKGAPVSKSLAAMINVACTSQCDTDQLISKYSIPSNCDKACAPDVNSEVWKFMDKRSQSIDQRLVDTQNLVAAGITPIVKLAETLKQQIMANSEAKTLISDALTMLGQVQFNLSVRRRYMIRPKLQRKYYSLCNISQPISSKLFGDDVFRDMKVCDSMVALGFKRGRGNYRFPRRGYGGGYGHSGYGGPGSNRFAPYPVRGQNRQQGRGYAGRMSRRPTATATAPNEMI